MNSEKKQNSRREFIAKFFSQVSFFSLGGLFVSNHAKALQLLESMPNPVTNDLQNNLLKYPKKQMQLAEIAECINYTGKWKTKCHMDFSDL